MLKHATFSFQLGFDGSENYKISMNYFDGFNFNFNF